MGSIRLFSELPVESSVARSLLANTFLHFADTDHMRVITQQLVRMLTLVLVAGLASACLVRYAPGSLVDERELNQRASEATLAALREQKARQRDVGVNFIRYLQGLAHGDLGFSESNHSSVSALLADRAPRTLRDLSFGLALAWPVGLGCAVAVACFPLIGSLDVAMLAVATLILSLPVALIAYFCLLAGQASGLVLAIALAPKVFQYSRGVLTSVYAAPHVERARSHGVSESAIMRRHILPSAGSQLIALAAASISLAIGAAIPIEAICDVPGLGRLAWQAAMARDLPLLINMTMLVTLATTTAMALSEVFHAQRGEFDLGGGV
jgi:peptide/nickel transport system permease protein